MPNLRVLSDNAIDRATLAASSTAGSFSVANLQLARKSDTWRTPAGTSGRLSATWATPETIQASVLAYCTLSPTATKRVRVTTETQATNLLVAPNDFTASASWPRTSLSVATGVAGPDGTNSAATLTATAAGANIYQIVSVGAANYASSIWIRRRTGSGAVSIRNAANTAWLPLTLSGTWTRFANDGGAASGSAQLNLLIATSGDAIDIAFAQLEAGPMSSWYPGARPLGYIDGWQSYALDSGAQLACPAPAPKLRGFTAAQAAGAYAFGGGAHARYWMPAPLQAYGIAVDIVDTNNAAGFIETAFWHVGPFWEAAINVDYGVSVQLVDSSRNDYSDASDLIAEVGTVSKQMNLPMSKLAPADCTALWEILRSGGSRYPSFISVFPGHSDLAFEARFQIYGKFVELPSMAHPSFNIASTTLAIKSV